MNQPNPTTNWEYGHLCNLRGNQPNVVSLSNIFFELFEPNNIFRAVLNPTIWGLNLTLTFIFVISKSRNQNCPDDISSNTMTRPIFMMLFEDPYFIQPFIPISLRLGIWTGHFNPYFLEVSIYNFNHHLNLKILGPKLSCLYY